MNTMYKAYFVPNTAPKAATYARPIGHGGAILSIMITTLALLLNLLKMS